MSKVIILVCACADVSFHIVSFWLAFTCILSPEMKFHFCKNDRDEITTRSEFHFSRNEISCKRPLNEHALFKNKCVSGNRASYMTKGLRKTIMKRLN